MTATELREYWHSSPFIPFKLFVPGRKEIRVPHPDFLSVSPSGRIAHVWISDEDWASLDVFLITAVETDSRNGKRGRVSRK
ncbi:MAG TPA: hypothetical protein VK474_06030 [Chthoniobacterales bacterium]|nr:hypothetical protein [Chthoniobacterales bacterium]